MMNNWVSLPVSEYIYMHINILDLILFRIWSLHGTTNLIIHLPVYIIRTVSRRLIVCCRWVFLYQHVRHWFESDWVSITADDELCRIELLHWLSLTGGSSDNTIYDLHYGLSHYFINIILFTIVLFVLLNNYFTTYAEYTPVSMAESETWIRWLRTTVTSIGANTFRFLKTRIWCLHGLTYPGYSINLSITRKHAHVQMLFFTHSLLAPTPHLTPSLSWF